MSSSNRLPVVVVAIALLTLACSSQRDDSMDPELRAQVEQLKEETARAATSMATAPHRLDVLWRWANAYALTGRPLPVNLPRDVAYLGVAVSDGTEPDPELLAALDRYIHELSVNDEQPGALGTLRFAATDPLPASTWQTVEQVYTVGSMAIQPGGTILVAKQLATDQGTLQHEDPAGDNYVSIRSSNPDVSFTRIRAPLSGMHGGWKSAAPMPAFRLEGSPLRPGETFTITYGDRSGGSRGFKIQTWSIDRLLLPIYIDFQNDGTFFTLAWPGIEVVGIEAVGVHAFAPSVVEPGEAFDLAVRWEDRYLNRAGTDIPACEVLLDGRPVDRIPEGGPAVTVLSGLTINRPGVHRFTVEAEDSAIAGTSNPIWVREDPPLRIWWGETHGHVAFADGQGTPEGYFRYARDDARLDFVTLSEHDLWLDDLEWRTLQDLTRQTTEQGRTLAFLGYEWTVPRQRGGHHNVLFRTPDRERVGFQSANRLSELYRGLHAANQPADVLVIPHAHEAADWTTSDTELERGVEIYSMHGTFEWFGNAYLKNGFEVAFIGASDEHRSRPGYANGVSIPPLAQFGGVTAVLAPAQTSDSIFDALRSRTTYATSGERIILDADLNGHTMGARQPDSQERRIRCRVMGTSPIDHVDVIKNGEVVYTQHYLQSSLTSRASLLVGFESSSQVFGNVPENPRGFRVWEGWLEVAGARVIDVSAPGFDNVYRDTLEVDPMNANRVRFHIETRGRRDTLRLELTDASAATVITLRLDQGQEEYGVAPPSNRPLASFPERDLRLALSDLAGGRLIREFESGPHTDRLTLQVVHADGARDVDFEFTDLTNTAPGDYYYVRVNQLDGGRAWSSPFWVGAEPTRP